MILLLGKNGYVGKKLIQSCSKSLQLISVSRLDIDYYDPKIFSDYLISQKIKFLVNAAGYTGKPNVDACEVAKAECLLGNAVLPGIIREVCEDLKIPWGHVSSGCIYSGRRPDGMGWKEDDVPKISFRSPPCSFYSGTKA